MRISDWSSDVCSSDLDVVAPVLAAHRAVGVEYHARGHRGLAHGVADVEALDALRQVGQAEHVAQRFDPRALRSEEHTSELQSLMRISYAVFCLKKKKTKYITVIINRTSTTTQTT